MVNQVIFHLAIPINSINEAKNFYSDILGAKIGRENQHAVIFDFYGHQLVGHTTKEILIPPSSIYPRHFGLIFIHESDWNLLLTRCQDHLELYQPAKLRFKEQLTEHQTFFCKIPFIISLNLNSIDIMKLFSELIILYLLAIEKIE